MNSSKDDITVSVQKMKCLALITQYRAAYVC